jgi:N utilization substance protein A
VNEIGESTMEKLIAAGITTVEQLADMTAEELGEVPGIGEKSVEKIAVAVRHYFGQYEEGEVRPEPKVEAVSTEEAASTEEAVSTDSASLAEAAALESAALEAAALEAPATEAASEEAAEDSSDEEVSSMTKTPEELLAAQAGLADGAEEIDTISTEDIQAAEDAASDANDASDAREEAIERDNDSVDSLVDMSQEDSTETIDNDSADPGSRA